MNATIARVMQDHCGAIKSEGLLDSGLATLESLKKNDVPCMRARNPHELIRTLEVLNVLANAELVLHACLARRASAEFLLFERSDYPEMDPPAWQKFVTVRLQSGKVVEGDAPMDYYGSLEEGYRANNQDYSGEAGP